MFSQNNFESKIIFIENIISPALSEDSKIFWSFIKAQRTDSVGVSPLKSEGRLVSDSIGKAEILNKQYKSVFVQYLPEF